MKIRLLLIAMFLLLVAGTALAAGAPAINDEAAFAQIKSLAGEWEGKDANGTSHLRYEVVSGGSAVLERFENEQMGPANAMVTVYYLDGGHLRLTHYCMAKNQPRMQAESFDAGAGELRFGFLDATGMSSAEAGHMHNAAFHFVDANHFASNWQFFEGGKPKFDESVQYTRVK
jgi:hypothetical protein